MRNLLFSPRQFLRFAWPALVLACLSGFFGSCERAKVDGGNRTSEGPHSDHPELESPKKLVVLTWDQYLQPEVVERYEEANGVEIVHQTIDNSAQFAQLLASKPGNFDVVIVDDRTLIELDALDLLQALDASLLENTGNLDPKFLDRDFDPENALSIPYLWGTTLIAYRKDLVPVPPRSWSLLLDETLKGQIALIDEPEDLLLIGLLANGHSPAAASPAEFEEATDLLLGHLDGHDGAMWELYEALDALDRGEISAAISYSGDALTYAEENDQIGYCLPEEGAPIWIDSFAVCRTSPNSQEAHRFINFMIEAEAAAATANGMRLASPNRAATPLIDESLLENPAIYPTDEVMARCQFVRLTGGENTHLVNRCISRIYDQARRNSETASSPERSAANETAIPEPEENPPLK